MQKPRGKDRPGIVRRGEKLLPGFPGSGWVRSMKDRLSTWPEGFCSQDLGLHAAGQEGGEVAGTESLRLLSITVM